jgi:hypothetical protein
MDVGGQSLPPILPVRQGLTSVHLVIVSIAIWEGQYGNLGIIPGEEKQFVTSLPSFPINQSSAERRTLDAEND